MTRSPYPPSRVCFSVIVLIAASGCTPGAAPPDASAPSHRSTGQASARASSVVVSPAPTPVDAAPAGTQPAAPAPAANVGPKFEVPASKAEPTSDAQRPAEADIDATALLPAVDQAERGLQLYSQHCAACHGERGDGQGIAATFVYPRPRDFRAGRFRLISTANGVPTPADLEAVLYRGMPGSSMVSWAHLPQKDRLLLAEVVLSFRREGAAEIERQLAADADEELSSDDLAERVATATTPGEVLDPGALPAATADSIVRGRELFVSKGCASCHGPTGRGDGQQQMVDAEGFATRPRDLTLGIYKGQHDALSLYRRLWLGLPGSPMPASQNLSREEVAAMVDFVRSLSDEATRESRVLRRVGLRAPRLDKIPAGPHDPAWASVAATEARLTPLWWRDGAASAASVQAARDDGDLALRLSWVDATPNQRAVLPDEFEDMVAVQLYEGSAEPFLGMGAAGAPIDLWQWRAGYKADGADDMLADEYPFDTPVYEQLFADRPRPDFVTARVAENPLATRAGSAGSLTAGGFGSTTFRPKASQLVEAEADWQNGRWTVVLRRPMSVPAEGGLALAAGQRYSVAVAVWDGAVRDRAGQKLISLWNDLVVE